MIVRSEFQHQILLILRDYSSGVVDFREEGEEMKDENHELLCRTFTRGEDGLLTIGRRNR